METWMILSNAGSVLFLSHRGAITESGMVPQIAH